MLAKSALVARKMKQRRESVGLSLLQDASITLEGVKFWGSPWQPEFCNWAFNWPRGYWLERVWSQIPPDTQVLITHTPPAGLLDGGVGCQDLRNRLCDLLALKLHVYGHVHSAYGQTSIGPHTFVAHRG